MAPVAQTPPKLNIPESEAIVNVRIIDTTSHIKGVPVSLFCEPEIKGHDVLDCPAYSFLVEHPSGRKLLWDLGVRKDLENFSPSIVKRIKDGGWQITVEKNVADRLQEGGVKPEEIESIIWRYILPSKRQRIVFLADRPFLVTGTGIIQATRQLFQIRRVLLLDHISKSIYCQDIRPNMMLPFGKVITMVAS